MYKYIVVFDGNSGPVVYDHFNFRNALSFARCAFAHGRCCALARISSDGHRRWIWANGSFCGR